MALTSVFHFVFLLAFRSLNLKRCKYKWNTSTTNENNEFFFKVQVAYPQCTWPDNKSIKRVYFSLSRFNYESEKNQLNGEMWKSSFLFNIQRCYDEGKKNYHIYQQTYTHNARK